MQRRIFGERKGTKAEQVPTGRYVHAPLAIPPMRKAVAFILALWVGSPSIGASPPAPTAAQVAAIAEAQRIGRDIYDFDQAAWGSTDALLAALPDPDANGVRGWIVEREPGGTVATYYGLRDGKPYKIFVAHALGRKVSASHVVGADEDATMTPVEQRMVAARAVALERQTLAKIGFQPCERTSLNSVVLVPPTADAPVSVYYLTPQTARDRYPFGGHYRVDIAADGSIVGSRAFAKSCVAMTPQVPPGGRAAGMFITHILDPQPTEIHAWLSLVSNIPIFVATMPSHELWDVKQGMITLLRTLPDSGAPAS